MSESAFILIEEKNYHIKVYEDDIVETFFNEDTIIDEKITGEIDKKLEEIKPGNRFYILSEAQGFFMISPDLRKAMASPTFSRPVAAVAFYSHDEKLNQMNETFNANTKPMIPIKFFTDKEKALEWLREIKETGENP